MDLWHTVGYHKIYGRYWFRWRNRQVHAQLPWLTCGFLRDITNQSLYSQRSEQEPTNITWRVSRCIHHMKIRSSSHMLHVYSIFTYIWAICWVNVGIYSIHGAYEVWTTAISLQKFPDLFKADSEMILRWATVHICFFAPSHHFLKSVLLSINIANLRFPAKK